jgi:hypothetical protein
MLTAHVMTMAVNRRIFMGVFKNAGLTAGEW